MVDHGAWQTDAEEWQRFYDAHRAIQWQEPYLTDLELEGFRNYVSPFAGNGDNLTSFEYLDHQRWLVQRGLYEASGSPDRLDKMLEFVTNDNPPLASDSFKPQEEHSSSHEGNLLFFFIASLIIIGIVVLHLV